MLRAFVAFPLAQGKRTKVRGWESMKPNSCELTLTLPVRCEASGGLRTNRRRKALQALTYRSERAPDRRLTTPAPHEPKYREESHRSERIPLRCGDCHRELCTATFSKSGSDARIESLRNFKLAFIDEFAIPGKRFNAAAFDAKVSEGNAKFQQAIADEKFTARRSVLVDPKGQFDADAAHLRSKASRGKITPALAGTGAGAC
jgi:hypothetical protein